MEMEGFRLSYAVPKIEWATSSTAPTGSYEKSTPSSDKMSNA